MRTALLGLLLTLFHSIKPVASRATIRHLRRLEHSNEVKPRKPRVHFLFMAVDRIQRLDIWQRFFKGASPDEFSILLHCKSPHLCQAQLRAAGGGEAWSKVPIVIKDPAPTAYCTDLVSAENRLLEEALKVSGTPIAGEPVSFLAANDTLDSGNPAQHDKFVLLSDSTLPVKPFRVVYDELTAKADSRFCIFPRQEWAEAPRELCVDRNERCMEWAATNQCHMNPKYMHFQCQKSCQVCTDLAVLTEGFPATPTMVSPKVHEWKTLNQADALRSVQLWKQGYLRHLMQSLHLNKISFASNRRNTGCLDEYWHFAALYGVFPKECLGKVDANEQCPLWVARGECTKNPNYMLHHCEASCSGCGIPAPKFKNGELFAFSLADNAGVQGQCDTFVKWSVPGAMGTNNTMSKLDAVLTSAGGKHVKFDGKTSAIRPETIASVSKWTLKALKDSKFLFARKFKASLNVVDACEPTADTWSRVVFGIEPPKRSQQTWMGDGFWVDSMGKKVSIFSDQKKPNHVVVDNPRNPKWAGVGTTCGEQISIFFQNQKRAVGFLDASDGTTITFTNGAVWHRDFPWQGDGSWRDTAKNRVTIRTTGGTSMVIKDHANPDWNAKGRLDGALSDTFKAVFAKKISGKPVTLWGTLSEDASKITWHNGQVWVRDGTFQPPCVCQPDNPAWTVTDRGASSDQSTCMLIDVGAGKGSMDFKTLLKNDFSMVGVDPNKCKAYMFEADAQYSQLLLGLQHQHPATVQAITSTAMYSCEPAQGSKATLFGGAMQNAGHGGKTPAQMMNLQKFLKQHALVHDHVLLKLDVGGSEWDMLPCLARSSAARLVDILYIRKYSPRDGFFGTTEDEVPGTLDQLRSLGVKIIEY